MRYYFTSFAKFGFDWWLQIHNDIVNRWLHPSRELNPFYSQLFWMLAFSPSGFALKTKPKVSCRWASSGGQAGQAYRLFCPLCRARAKGSECSVLRRSPSLQRSEIYWEKYRPSPLFSPKCLFSLVTFEGTSLQPSGPSAYPQIWHREAMPSLESNLSCEPKTYPFVKVYILAIGRLPFLWGKRLGVFLLDRTSRTTCK